MEGKTIVKRKIINLLKKTALYSIYKENSRMKHERNKLFPGKVRLVDLCNARYITRKPIYDFLIENADNISGNVLDFGCGSMEYKKILRNVNKYSGLDIEGADKNGFFAQDVIYYDGVHIPFENGIFDAVISIEVFEHVELLDDVLLELNRVMKQGKKLFFTVPMFFPGHLEPYDYRRFTKYGIKKKLELAGFAIEKIEGSTTFKNTLRRMKILELEKRGGQKWLLKIRYILSNICFLHSNNVTEDEKAPIDWLVICRKDKEL